MTDELREERRTPPLVGVVADDVTGCGDIGTMFAKHGYAVRIFTSTAPMDLVATRIAAARTDVAVVDTDSRYDRREVAYDKVRGATRMLAAAGAGVFYKKTCSVFRGNIGAEFDAMLDELGESFGAVVAAFPKNERVTRHGIQYVHGKPLAESHFARDPVHPRTQSSLVADLASQTSRTVENIDIDIVRRGAKKIRAALEDARHRGVAYALCDAELQDDLHEIALAAAGARVLLGASALAEELARVWDRVSPFDAPAEAPEPHTKARHPTLVIAGSVMPQTRAQISALEESGCRVLVLESEGALERPDDAAVQLGDEAAAVLAEGRNVAVRSQSSPEDVDRARELGGRSDLDPIAVSRRISEVLARVADRAIERSSSQRLVVLGGDTSAAVCARLGIMEMLVLDELDAGVPVTASVGERARPLRLVLKAGSFGAPNFLVRAIARLSR